MLWESGWGHSSPIFVDNINQWLKRLLKKYICVGCPLLRFWVCGSGVGPRHANSRQPVDSTFHFPWLTETAHHNPFQLSAPARSCSEHQLYQVTSCVSEVSASGGSIPIIRVWDISHWTCVRSSRVWWTLFFFSLQVFSILIRSISCLPSPSLKGRTASSSCSYSVTWLFLFCLFLPTQFPMLNILC